MARYAHCPLLYSDATTYQVDGITGFEDIRIHDRLQPSQPAQPLRKVAHQAVSCHEISLGIQVVTRDLHSIIPTLVFDEVDDRISGRYSPEVVGRMLRSVANADKFFCVTH